MPQYSIELHIDILARFGAHYFWALRNLSTGVIERQVHGWNVDPSTGVPYSGLAALIHVGQLRLLKNEVLEESNPYVTYITGSAAEAGARWQAGVAMGEALDRLRLPYPLGGIGTNSNSFARTIGRAMGFDADAIRDPATGEVMLPVAPGFGTDLTEDHPGLPQGAYWGTASSLGVTYDPLEVDPTGGGHRGFTDQELDAVRKRTRDALQDGPNRFRRRETDKPPASGPNAASLYRDTVDPPWDTTPVNPDMPWFPSRNPARLLRWADWEQWTGPERSAAPA